MRLWHKDLIPYLCGNIDEKAWNKIEEEFDDYL